MPEAITELEKAIEDTDWDELVEAKELVTEAIVNLALIADKESTVYIARMADAAIKQRAALLLVRSWITDMQTAAHKDGWPVGWDLFENPNYEWSDEHGDLVDVRTGKPLG